MALMEAFFDESMDDGVMVVAGIMLGESKAKSLDRKWEKMMGIQAPGIPYFHMVDVAHANGPYAELGHDNCDALSRTAIGHAVQDVEVFTAISLREEDFYSRPSPLADVPDPLANRSLSLLHSGIFRQKTSM